MIFFLELLLRAPKGVTGGELDPSGTAPFFTGVLGGRVLSMYSGLMYGPKDTRFLDDGVSAGVSGMDVATFRGDLPAAGKQKVKLRYKT